MAHAVVICSLQCSMQCQPTVMSFRSLFRSSEALVLCAVLRRRLRRQQRWRSSGTPHCGSIGLRPKPSDGPLRSPPPTPPATAAMAPVADAIGMPQTIWRMRCPPPAAAAMAPAADPRGLRSFPLTIWRGLWWSGWMNLKLRWAACAKWWESSDASMQMWPPSCSGGPATHHVHPAVDFLARPVARVAEGLPVALLSCRSRTRRMARTTTRLGRA